MAIGETARLATILTLKDGLTPGLSKATASVSKLDKGMYRTGRGIGEVGKSFAKAGLLAGGVAVTGLAAAAKAAIDYQDAFQGVVKTVDSADLKSAGLTFEDLSDSIRKMSREMPNSAIELAGIAEAAGALGIKAKDIESFTRQVAILASTTNVSADDAATALGQLQNVIGLTGDEFDNFAAALVDLGNKGASTEADILEIARRAGGAAKLFGIAKDETLGWAAAAANLGLNSELAGTSLQNAFLKLMPKVSKGSKTLSAVMGKSAAEIRKAFKKDAGGAMEDLLRQLGKMPKDARLAAVQKIFGKGSGITRLILGLADSIDTNLTPSLNTSEQAWKDSTAAAAEFEKRNATVKSAFSRLKNNILDAAVTLGEGFAPALGRAADKLSKFLAQDGNRSKLKNLGEDIGKAIDKIDFDKLLKAAEGVTRALGPAAGILAKIAETIGKLPPELLGAGGAVVITNKVTGGLVLKGVGDVVGGLGESLAKGLASKIPIFGKAFVQPVFVTNMGGLGGGAGAGGATGGAGKLAKGLAAISIITDIAAVVATQQEVSAQNTQIASDINANLQKGIDVKTPKELQTALDGVRQGINDIQANPLNVLVAGDALTTLKSMESDLKSKLANGQLAGQFASHGGDKWAADSAKPITKEIQTLRQKLDAAVRDGNKQAADRIRAKLDALLQKENQTKNTMATGQSGIKATLNGKLSSANAKLDAIRHKKTSFRTVVNVRASTSVSVRDINKSTTTSVRFNTHAINQAY